MAPSKKNQLPLRRTSDGLGRRVENDSVARHDDLETDGNNLVRGLEGQLEDALPRARASRDVAAVDRGGTAGLEVDAPIAEAPLDAAQSLIGQFAGPVEQIG